MKQITVWAVILGASASAWGQDPSTAGVLQKVADHYKHMRTYVIEAEVKFTVSKAGQAGSGEQKTILAVGNEGMFRVETRDNGNLQVRVSDGKLTWKALPGQKIWSRQELAQNVNSGDVSSGDSEEEPDEPQALDLFSQSQNSFVKRYTGLSRYASTAAITKTEKVKFNSEKVECFVVQIPVKGGVNRLYVAKDSFLVLRHIEVGSNNGSQTEVTTDYKKISEDIPPANLFEYQPSNGSKQVDDVALPGERNVSLVGQRAADFTLKTVNGEPVHLADLRGKIVLLDFWATWCPPCRHELPTIEALSRKYKDHNVVVLGINDEEVSTAKHFLEKNHPDLETLHDAGHKVHRTYGCSAIPTVVVIDPAGKVTAHFIGQRSEDVLVSALKGAGMN